MRTILLAVIAGVVLAGCSASPFDTRGGTDRLVGSDTLPQPDKSAPKVLWGGQIVDVSRVGNDTRLEVRAHPLGYGDRPLIGVRSTGMHFVIHHPQTLDLDQYAPGRYLTAMGTYTDVESISIAGTEFEMPVMASEQIELWPAKVYPDSLRPLGTHEMRDTPWYPGIITPSTATAGFVSSVNAGSN